MRRALTCIAVVAGVIAAAGVLVLRADSTYVFHGLMSRALPLVVLSAVCGLGSLYLLVRHTHRGARILAIGAVASVTLAWGVAQWPYLLPTTLEVADAASPSSTMAAILIVFAAAALLILPSIALLYILDQKGELS